MGDSACVCPVVYGTSVGPCCCNQPSEKKGCRRSATVWYALWYAAFEACIHMRMLSFLRCNCWQALGAGLETAFNVKSMKERCDLLTCATSCAFLQRIRPPPASSVLVRNGAWARAESLSELGIYGTYLAVGSGVEQGGQGVEVLLNKQVSLRACLPELVQGNISADGCACVCVGGGVRSGL